MSNFNILMLARFSTNIKTLSGDFFFSGFLHTRGSLQLVQLGFHLCHQLPRLLRLVELHLRLQLLDQLLPLQVEVSLHRLRVAPTCSARFSPL